MGVVDLVSISGRTSWIAHAHRVLNRKTHMFYGIYVLLLCFCKCCMKLGDKKRKETRESHKREREAVILARAESSVSYTDDHATDVVQPDATSKEDSRAYLPVDLMDIDEELTEEEARSKHHTGLRTSSKSLAALKSY